MIRLLQWAQQAGGLERASDQLRLRERAPIFEEGPLGEQRGSM